MSCEKQEITPKGNILVEARGMCLSFPPDLNNKK